MLHGPRLWIKSMRHPCTTLLLPFLGWKLHPWPCTPQLPGAMGIFNESDFAAGSERNEAHDSEPTGTLRRNPSLLCWCIQTWECCQMPWLRPQQQPQSCSSTTAQPPR